MKKQYRTLTRNLSVLLLALCFSCDDAEFIEEKPLDFYTIGNSYNSIENFESALTDLYARTRANIYTEENISSASGYAMICGTDVAKNARGDNRRFGDYVVWMDPTQRMVSDNWNAWFKIISNANTIISRLPGSELTDAEQQSVAAEAKFFRAFSYRFLVYLFGGVPIILDEISLPKTDLQRATKEEVLNQIVQDAREAANDLPFIDQAVDGKVSNLVAQHLLAETYVALGNYDDAIAAATVVIDDPNTGLMTERFGSRAGENPGDVYWDLFRRGNQNRSSGNTEALWVAQMETDVLGGLLESSGPRGFLLERFAAPVVHPTFKDPDGEEGSLGDPVSDLNVGGRGASFMMNTDWFLDEVWESDFDNDMRNAPHNIVRDFIYNNPESAWFDSSSVKYPSPTDIAQDWRWYPWPTKVTTPGNHPDALYEDQANQILKNFAGSTYRDDYFLRLAETYLLRAEAYLLKGDLANAAVDINSVRTRVNATPVSAGEVTLDYILEERARELIYEEPRRITLSRTGTLVERVRLYNDLSGPTIEDHHALWPIPFADIEANTDAALEQNPGYN